MDLDVEQSEHDIHLVVFKRYFLASLSTIGFIIVRVCVCVCVCHPSLRLQLEEISPNPITIVSLASLFQNKKTRNQYDVVFLCCPLDSTKPIIQTENIPGMSEGCPGSCV